MDEEELETTARTYRLIQEEIEFLREQAEECRAGIIAEMTERRADNLRAGEFEIIYKIYEQTQVDAERLKAGYPLVYGKTLKTVVKPYFKIVENEALTEVIKEE